MKPLTWAIFATTLGYMVIKLFWFTLAIVIIAFMIRGTMKGIRNKVDPPNENKILWQKWDRNKKW